jgi:hypothetical protein
LAQAAEALGDLREQLVFVGGCATALLITDPGAAPVRVTEDVDAIVAITALPDYHRYFESHDLEDVLSVIDGRPELTDELKVAESALRIYVAQIFANLLKDEDFLNALPGLVMDGSPQVRRPVVLERLRTIAQMREG